MKMGSLVGWGIALGGGYLLLKSLGYDPLAIISGGVAVGPGTPVNTTGSPSANNNSPSVNATSASVTLQGVKDAMTASGLDVNKLFATDTFNFFYRQVRGVPAPAPEDLFPGVDRNKMYSISEWWTAMMGKGFSGIGMIAHRVNPYANPIGNFFGQNISPNGIEYLRILKG